TGSILTLKSVGGGGRIRTFVDAKSADLQSAAIDRSATPPNLRLQREYSLFGPPKRAGVARKSNELRQGPNPPIQGICRLVPIVPPARRAAAIRRSGSTADTPC